MLNVVLLKFVWVGTKFKFFFNSLKVSFVNHFSLELITCPAKSDWSPVVFSIVLRSLTKFSCFALWRWWWWLVGHFLVIPCETQRPFLFFDSEIMFFFYISVLGSCSCSLDCFSNCISSLSSLISCCIYHLLSC